MMHVLSFLFHDVYEGDPSESGFAGPAADRYKLRTREFEQQLLGLARVRKDSPICVTRLPREDGAPVPFVITVDDGGVSFYTTAAERLERLGWRAHCFVTTGCIGQKGFLEKRQIRELHGRGHLIGSHSVSHPTRFSACEWDTMVREWGESRKVLADLLGHDVTAASVPGGYFSAKVAAAAREAGLTVLFTSEPETRVRRIAGCMVMGRFTVRNRCRADFAAKLGTLERSTLFRERLTWSTKKVAKRLLGRAYSVLAARGLQDSGRDRG